MKNLDTIEKIGLILIFNGVIAWPVGLWVFHWDATPLTLTWHLSGVIPGFILRRYKFLMRIGGKLKK